MPDPSSPATLADALADALRAACAYDPNTQVAPACVVWTDEKSEWASLVARLRPCWPHLVSLGEYDPTARTGPAIWIRTVLDTDLAEGEREDGVLPVVYLPGLSRSQLRAVASLDRMHQPLAELQFRGALFSQVNGRDWTARAFLGSEDGGLGLDVARDADTTKALARALPLLADRPLADLRGGRLEAADFNALLAPDPVRDLLRWMDDPEGAGQDARTKGAFRDVCRQRFGFDPEADGRLGAALRLGSREGEWTAVWDRFAEAPHRYPNLPALLRQAAPPATTGDLFAGEGTVRETWPQDNTAEEEILRSSLLSLGSATPARAAEQLRALEERHGVRRDWVWAALGKAPLAVALEPLAALAEATAQPVAGPTPEACADTYVSTGWRADEAFLDTLASDVRGADEAAVVAAATALYRPWLATTAGAFQAALAGALPPQPEVVRTAPSPGVVWLFVDALRYDLGQRLAARLEAVGARVERGTSWAAFPSVTATAKPACSPVADGVRGGPATHHFAPETEEGKALSTYQFRSLLADRGFQILDTSDTGDPSGSAWTEIGTIDSTGHSNGWILARRLGELIDGVAMRVRDLLEVGWTEVRVVTDHGWLLLPGGLPKSELPKSLASERWARAAELVPGSATSLPTHGWYWNSGVLIAVAPTIHALSNGVEYAHGGLTLQECLVPRLVVTSGGADGGSARITSATWTRLRCRIETDGEASGLSADLRRRPADASSSVALGVKPVEDGGASLIVPDDTLEGADAFAVLLDADGRVVHQLSTVVGG